MKFMNQWADIVSLSAYMPITAIGFTADHVAEELYSLGGQAFLYTVRHDVDLRPSPVPLVTMVIWATDEGVARRFALRQIERDSGIVPALPPSVLVRPPATYRAILDRIDDTEDRVILSACYRIAQDGAAIGGSIRHVGREYCFRAVNPTDDEPVAAVKIRLPHASSA